LLINVQKEEVEQTGSN